MLAEFDHDAAVLAILEADQEDTALCCLERHAKPGQLISIALAVKLAREWVQEELDWAAADNVPASKATRDGDVSRERPKKRKRPRDGTNELVVLKAMEGDLDDEWTQATLFDICVDGIIAPASKYRRQYMVTSVNKLIKAGWVDESDEGVYSLIEAT